MRLLVALAALAASLSPATAQAGRPAESDDLIVAVFEAPPLASRAADGTWSGLGVELAVDLGQALGRGVRFVGVAPDSALAALTTGRADLALTALAPGVEAISDVGPAFVDADLAIARPATSQIATVARRFFSPTFFAIAGALAVLLFVAGALMWLVERRHDSDDFTGTVHGLWDGFWWAGVTLTTIGYGDTVPRSHGGRALALVWMLLSMAITAVLTAALVSALGLRSPSSGARVPDDLRGDRVGVVAGTPAAALIARAGLDAAPFPTAAAALAALDADSVDAVAGSALRLRAAGGAPLSLRTQTTGVAIERWAFATAEGSALREPAARAVLDRVSGPDWPEVVRRWTE
ncbi:ion channel [Rubrivirga sp. IMCC43871]|uniref:ion channel n=1 Tax=Rubrivirga sp. IMCC43871 TaxID=3391575 RepID=UPI00398F944F